MLHCLICHRNSNKKCVKNLYMPIFGSISLLISALLILVITTPYAYAHKSHDDETVHQYIAIEAFKIWPGNSTNYAAFEEMFRGVLPARTADGKREHSQSLH